MQIETERIESLKAGTVSAVAFLLAYSITTLGNNFVLIEWADSYSFPSLDWLKITTSTNLLVGIGIAWWSGFLFGVTYRYVIREDNNSHLKSGAVLAFGLVRGFAQVEAGLNTDALWSAGVLAIESILLFAVARLTLDWVIQLGWVKPFSSV